MKIKALILQICFSMIMIFTVFTCEKTTDIDPRDAYAGKYEGLQIYFDYQQSIRDTTISSIFLRKFGSDSLFELDLPVTSEMYYYYETGSGEFEFYGSCYHCPSLTIRKDTLYSLWVPTLAPREYLFIMVKTIEQQ
jgi:hypothetical protein